MQIGISQAKPDTFGVSEVSRTMKEITGKYGLL